MTRPQPGDIVLYVVTPQSGWTSKVVAIAELLWGAGKGVEQYSHAAVWHQDGFQFEAVWPKTGRYPVDTSRPYEVWRVEGLTQAQRVAVLNWCATHLEEWYDMLELLTFGLFQHRNAAVCSQFVARAYAHAGVHFSKEGKPLVSPNALADDKRVKLIVRYVPPKGER